MTVRKIADTLKISPDTVRKDNNLEIKKIPDDHYGHINAYPLDAWYTVYPEFDLPELDLPEEE